MIQAMYEQSSETRIYGDENKHYSKQITGGGRTV
jgi:hypothetical protein